jgi:dTDP-4-amino-4,6-dideoxygalactose transaminase
LHSLYQKRLGYRAGQFPNAEKHFEQAISLPLFPDMSEEEIERVTGALREISCTYAK